MIPEVTGSTMVNFKEGMRRVGIVLGVIGACVCTPVTYVRLKDNHQQRSAYEQFQAALALPSVKKAMLKTRLTYASAPSGQSVWDVLGDPKFGGLPLPERRKVMSALFQDFRSLPAAEQDELITGDILDRIVGEKRVLEDVQPENVQPVVRIDDGGVRSIKLNREGTAVSVFSITLTDGEILTGSAIDPYAKYGGKMVNAPPPPRSEDWAFLLLPVIGFIVPWGAVKILAWVAAGFNAGSR